jgi:hypothetical protein
MKLVFTALMLVSFQAFAANKDYLCMSSVAKENKAAFTTLTFNLKEAGGVKSAVRKEYSYEGEVLSDKKIAILDASEYRSVQIEDEKIIVLMDEEANFYNCSNESI